MLENRAESHTSAARFVRQPVRLPERRQKKDATANPPNFYTELIFWQWLKIEIAKTPNNQKPTLTNTKPIDSKTCLRIKLEILQTIIKTIVFLLDSKTIQQQFYHISVG